MAVLVKARLKRVLRVRCTLLSTCCCSLRRCSDNSPSPPPGYFGYCSLTTTGYSNSSVVFFFISCQVGVPVPTESSVLLPVPSGSLIASSHPIASAAFAAFDNLRSPSPSFSSAQMPLFSVLSVHQPNQRPLILRSFQPPSHFTLLLPCTATPAAAVVPTASKGALLLFSIAGPPAAG